MDAVKRHASACLYTGLCLCRYLLPFPRHCQPVKLLEMYRLGIVHTRRFDDLLVTLHDRRWHILARGIVKIKPCDLEHVDTKATAKSPTACCRELNEEEAVLAGAQAVPSRVQCRGALLGTSGRDPRPACRGCCKSSTRLPL